MMKKCSNGRSLLITNVESCKTELGANWVPFVVLLTAWSIQAVKQEGLPKLIKFLLSIGAKNFVCVGNCAEDLHDAIDEVIYEYDDEHGIDTASKVLTTYHDDEPLEESLNYFVHGTETSKSQEGGLLALVGKDAQQVVEILKKA